MNKILLHTILPFFGLLLYACTQDDFDSEFKDVENAVSFQIKAAATRGFVDNLVTEGTELCIYGYHDSNFLAADKTYPLAGKSLAYMDGLWTVVDNGTPITYYWEGEGEYRFFGWLKNDAAGLSAPTSNWTANYDNNTKKLTLSATLDKNYNQFDFLYSGIDYRNMTATQKDRSTVEMNMSHLFSAFGIGFINNSDFELTINSIALYRLRKQGSAAIDFSQNATTVAYNLSAADATPFVSNSASYTINGNTTVSNVFAPDAEQSYYMVWPQTISDAYMTISYTIEGEDAPRTKTLPLEPEEWVAGKKHSYNIKFDAFGITIETTAWEEPNVNDVIIKPNN